MGRQSVSWHALCWYFAEMFNKIGGFFESARLRRENPMIPTLVSNLRMYSKAELADIGMVIVPVPIQTPPDVVHDQCKLISNLFDGAMVVPEFGNPYQFLKKSENQVVKIGGVNYLGHAPGTITIGRISMDMMGWLEYGDFDFLTDGESLIIRLAEGAQKAEPLKLNPDGSCN